MNPDSVNEWSDFWLPVQPLWIGVRNKEHIFNCILLPVLNICPVIEYTVVSHWECLCVLLFHFRMLKCLRGAFNYKTFNKKTFININRYIASYFAAYFAVKSKFMQVKLAAPWWIIDTIRILYTSMYVWFFSVRKVWLCYTNLKFIEWFYFNWSLLFAELLIVINRLSMKLQHSPCKCYWSDLNNYYAQQFSYKGDLAPYLLT